MARIPVFTDTFDSSISGSYDNGPGGLSTMSWATGGVIRAGSGSDGGIVRNTGTFGNDQYVTVGIANISNGDNGVFAMLCHQGGSTDACYLGQIYAGAGDSKYQIWYVSGPGAFTLLADAGSAAGVSNITLTLEREGNNLRLYTNEGSGEVLRVSASHSALSTGRPGCGAFNASSAAAASITSLEGGTLGSGVVELVVADSAHGHAVDSPSLTQANTLALAGAAHTHFADAIGLTQAISIAVAECVHGLLVDGVALVQGHMLQVGDSAHLHISEGLELTQANILAIGSAVHAHTADSADMSAADVLSVDSSAHEQTAEGAELVQASILTIGDSVHSLVSVEILLSQSTILAVGEAVHAMVADGVTLSHSAILAVASAAHLHAANEIDLTQAATIVVSDSLHALVSQQVNLLMPGGLGVPPGRTIVVQAQQRVIVVRPESRIYRVH